MKITELSIRVSEVLDDSGAGEHTVMERRRTYLRRERMETLNNQLLGNNKHCFHFGSQSEGTTLPGLQSDVDSLAIDNNENIMTVVEDWEAGMKNFLMLHDDSTDPQQYLLQVFKDDTKEPETNLHDYVFVMNDSGQVLLSAERYKQYIERRSTVIGETTKHGPSVSWVPDWDIVHALHVRKPLRKIQNWIDRCRRRPWPPAKLLEDARVAPSFLVPSGHPDSKNKRDEWRLSPNLIERMLMFSFNRAQIKCYIILKLLNKSQFAKIVGDSLTSFHCKTIMFFTIERTRPALWFEHNLMLLLLRCLHVLRKWLRLGRLPHYIIEGVNLFDGKLSTAQQIRLLVYVNSMIKNKLQDVLDIDIDNIGRQLQASSVLQIVPSGELGRVCLRDRISLLLKFECLERFKVCFRMLIDKINNANNCPEQEIKHVLRNAFEWSKKFRMKTVVLKFIKHLHELNYSMQSSNCLRLRNVVTIEIINCLKYSLNTDVASSRLKLAAILYCSGHIHAAVRVLEDVERRYHSKVKAVCGCRHIPGDRDLNNFAKILPANSDPGFSEPPFAFCVTFVMAEWHCTPSILLFEMNRNIDVSEVDERTYTEKEWMDFTEVDARPFLHYLQYLTYGGLGERSKQLDAFRVLDSYMCDNINKINLYHKETAYNLLGHCCEMEGEYDGALYYYRASLRLCCTINNAANRHVLCVMHLLSGK